MLLSGLQLQKRSFGAELLAYIGPEARVANIGPEARVAS